MRALSGCAALALLGVLSACALPSFDKVDKLEAKDDGTPDASTKGQACGRSDELAPECDRCIQMNCCDAAMACTKGTDCGKDMVTKISPSAQFSDEFVPLLGCMQENCDDECGISWGCIDDYDVASPNEASSVSVQLIDFAAVPPRPLPDITTNACRSVDPACLSGLATSSVSDESGQVELSLPSEFDGYFQFLGGGYTATTAQWSEPVFRNSGFVQLLLTDNDVQNLALATGVHGDASDTFDPALGHIIFRAQNCLPLAYLDRVKLPRAEAADVRVMIDPAPDSSPVFYTDKLGGVAPGLEATSPTGVGGAFNFPQQNRRVTAFDAKSGRRIAAVTAFVRPKAIAFVYLVPGTSE